MTTSSRYLKYSFTCPNGHTEIREEMIFADGPAEAVNVVMKKQLVCGYCKTELTPKSLIQVMMNEAMPRAANGV